VTEKQKNELLLAASKVRPGCVIKIPKGVSVREAGKVLSAVNATQPELKPFTITSTVKLEATDTRAAILKASQLLAEVTHGTPYEFEEFSVKVE